MTMENGRFVPDTSELILEVLMENAQNVFGDDMSKSQESNIQTFYRPVSLLLADIQVDIATVLRSSQLQYAQGNALDLLVALIGVARKDALASTGEVMFSRSTNADVDYTVPAGTTVQTDSNDPVRFSTTKSVTMVSGTQSITAEIEADEPGTNGDVGSNTLTVMTDPPAGIESVTNNSPTFGGEDEEGDEALRARARSELSDGMRGTARAVQNQLLKVEGVTSVSLFINDDDTDDAAGRPPQHTEYVVEGGGDQAVGQTIFDTKAAGDGTLGGYVGSLVEVTADVGNGQTHPVAFSRSQTVKIYVDLDIETTKTFEGVDEVKNAIVQYIGGVITSGDEEDGDLRVGDDVIYTKVLSAIMSVNGVADAPSVTVGTSPSPTGTSNIVVDDTESGKIDATDTSISITEL